MFALDLCPCSEGFSPGIQVFLPPQIQNFKIQIQSERRGEKSHLLGFTLQFALYLVLSAT